MRARILISAASLATVAILGGQMGISTSHAAVGASTAAPAAGPRLVQSAGASETSANTTLTALFRTMTSAGNLLVLSASVSTGTSNRITSVTDSAGGSWKRAGTYAVTGHNSDGEMWYSADALPTTRITVHTSSRAIASLSIQEFSGVAGIDPLDGAAGTSKLSTSPASGPLTPAAADLMVGFIAGHGSAQPITVTAPGYTTQGQQTSAATQVTSVVAGYQVLGTASRQNFTGRLGTSMYWAAGIAAFRPGAPPPGDFSISASPASVAVTPGKSTAVTIGTSVTSGAAQPIVLSLTGLPGGASASFAPPAINAGQQSVLTISVPVSQPPATSSLTITGTGTLATHSTPLSLTVSPLGAIRAAFYYPWFPEAWNQSGQNPFTNYLPSRGFYTTDVPTVTAQIADMQYGGITMGIASWWGQGTITDKRWPTLMQAARGTGFTWAPYYEPNSPDDKAPQNIADNLHFIMATYGGPGSALANLPGQGMPVFVYNADDVTTADGCLSVTRWNQVQQIMQQQFGQQIYVDLKVFPGFTTCPGASGIEGWHQYGPDTGDNNFAQTPTDGAYTISPGFWKSGVPFGTGTFLARDLGRWQASVAAMNASGAKWQLITTYNEWGEGTAIESSSGCRSPAPAGALCDWSAGNTVSAYIMALHNAPPPG
jgi:hypothetical protein